MDSAELKQMEVEHIKKKKQQLVEMKTGVL